MHLNQKETIHCIWWNSASPFIYRSLIFKYSRKILLQHFIHKLVHVYFNNSTYTNCNVKIVVPYNSYNRSSNETSPVADGLIRHSFIALFLFLIAAVRDLRRRSVIIILGVVWKGMWCISVPISFEKLYLERKFQANIIGLQDIEKLDVQLFFF